MTALETHARIRTNVVLTPRDLNLMEMLYHSVALSYSQIERKVFSGKDKSTILNRLARLEDAGLIRRFHVHGIVTECPNALIKVVFQLTVYGIRELSRWRQGIVESTEPVRLNAFSLSHDLQLVDLADAFRSQFVGAKVIDGRLWKGGIETTRHTKPDLILKQVSSTKPWAVELELTPKSDKRYREIVLRYRLSNDFERVLYVTDHRQIVARLAKILDGKFAKMGIADSSFRFIHTSLKEILDNRKGVINR